MYKVFIQNKPIFFISEKEMKNYDGIFIQEGLALAEKVQVTNLLTSLSEELSLHILCKKPTETFELFFADHEKIEAAGGIVQRKDSFLFIKRNGVWDLPKGKLEENETPEIGAIREIEEECGIDLLTIIEPITITYHTYPLKKSFALKKTYWFSLTYDGPKKGIPQLSEGITKISWKKREKVDKIKNNTYSSIEDVVSIYFAKKNQDHTIIEEKV
jgi:8-oxo-dGTP pyrophosphatase MutT (NUDIX family)